MRDFATQPDHRSRETPRAHQSSWASGSSLRPCESFCFDVTPRSHGIEVGHAVGQTPLQFGPLPLRKRRCLRFVHHVISDRVGDLEPLFDAEPVDPEITK